MKNTEPTKPLEYYQKLIADMERTRALYPLNETSIRTHRLLDRILNRKFQQSDDEETREPLTENQRQRLEAIPKEPLEDHIISVLARDKILATDYLKAENTRLNEDLKKRNQERDEAAAKGEVEISQARLKAQDESSSLDKTLNQWQQNSPRHNIVTAFIASLGQIATDLGINGRQERIDDYEIRWKARQQQATLEKEQISNRVAQAERHAEYEISIAARNLSHAEREVKELQVKVDSWLGQGEKWAAALLPEARGIDGNVQFPAIRDGLFKGEQITEQEWQLYEGINRTIAKVVGLEAARASGPGKVQYAQEQTAQKHTRQFLNLIDAQMPDDIWRLKLAKERFEKAKKEASDNAGIGPREHERSLADEMVAAAERARKRYEEQRRQEEKDARKREEEIKKHQETQQQHTLAHLIVIELNLRSQELEAHARAHRRTIERSRGWGLER